MSNRAQPNRLNKENSPYLLQPLLIPQTGIPGERYFSKGRDYISQTFSVLIVTHFNSNGHIL